MPRVTDHGLRVLAYFDPSLAPPAGMSSPGLDFHRSLGAAQVVVFDEMQALALELVELDPVPFNLLAGASQAGSSILPIQTPVGNSMDERPRRYGRNSQSHLRGIPRRFHFSD